MAGSNEDWRKTADTTKMSSEEVKKAGVEASQRPPGSNPGGVLHQRRSMPFSRIASFAAVGSGIVGAMWYFTLYTKKKSEASAVDVAKVSVGAANPEDTHPAPAQPANK